MYVHVRLSGWEGEAPAELRKKLSGWEGEAPAELRKKLGGSLVLPLLGYSAGASFSRCLAARREPRSPVAWLLGRSLVLPLSNPNS